MLNAIHWEKREFAEMLLKIGTIEKNFLQLILDIIFFKSEMKFAVHTSEIFSYFVINNIYTVRGGKKGWSKYFSVTIVLRFI